MNVLHVNTGTFGHATYLRELRENASCLGEGWNMECLTLDALIKKRGADKLAIGAAVRIAARIAPGLAWWGRWLIEETQSRAVARALTTLGGRWDVWHLHTQALAYRVARRRQSPALVVSLDMTVPLLARFRGTAQGVGYTLVRRREHAALRRADCVMAWSESAATSVREDYGVDHPVVVSPPVNRVFFDIGAARLSGTVKVCEGLHILFVGNDWARKGGPDLFRMLDETGVAGHVTVISGDAPAELGNRPGTTVLRGVNHEDRRLHAAFERADLFVLPSREEAFGIVVLEAMAAALPVVATDILAIREMVDDTKSGRLVPPGDVAALGAAVGSFLSDRDRRHRAGLAGYEKAVRMAHPDRVLPRIARVYSRAADARSAASRAQ